MKKHLQHLHFFLSFLFFICSFGYLNTQNLNDKLGDPSVDNSCFINKAISIGENDFVLDAIDFNYRASEYEMTANNKFFYKPNTLICTAVSIGTQPQNQTVNVGSTATFSVTPSGTAPFQYFWYKNNIQISGATSASYTTPPLTATDNGNTYYCNVTNCNFQNGKTSNSATLTVNIPCTAVTIISQPQNQILNIGSTATFNVEVAGTAPFLYFWYKNNIQISGASSASYTTPPLTATDNGNTYYCNIVNCNLQSGTTSNSATLTFNCVQWINGQPTNNEVRQAAEYLCQKKIFLSNTINYNNLNNYLTQDAALSTLRGLYYFNNSSLPSSFVSDYYPTLFTDIDNLDYKYQQALRVMLFLDYQDGQPCITRDFYQIYPISTIYQGYILRMLFEAWNIQPDNTGWNPFDHTASTFANNIYNDDVNYGYFKKMASLSNLASGYFNSGSFDYSSQKVGEFFFIMLHRLMTQYSHPTINDTQFYTPNNFQKNTGSIGSDINKAVFSNYEKGAFNIPSGGLGLDFSFGYNSSWLDMPLIPNPSNNSSAYDLLRQVRSKHKLYPIGLGWTHSYNTFVQVLRDEVGNEKYYIFRWGNGDLFLLNAQTMTFETKGIYAKITVSDYSVGRPRVFSFTTKNQIEYVFYRDGLNSDQFILEQIRDRNGNWVQLIYESAVCSISPSSCINSIDRRLKTVTDHASNRSLTFNYLSGNDLLSSVTDGTRTIYFNPNPSTLNLDTYTDAMGHITIYSYCGQEDCKNLLTKITLPKGNTINNTYFKRKLQITQSSTYLINISFTPTYHLGTTSTLTQVTVSANGQNYNTSYIHNSDGTPQLISTATSNFSFAYTDTQNPTLPTSIIDNKTNITDTFTYSTNGNTLNHTKLATGISTITESSVYDIFNNVTQHTDFNGGITRNTYDARGNLINSTDPMGGVTQFNLLPSGLLNYIINPSLLKTSFDYNIYGNLNLIQKDLDANTHITVLATYDNLSRITGMIDSKSILTTYEWDNNDNPTNKIIDPTGLNLNTKTFYDANDNPFEVKGANGVSTYLGYDPYTDDFISETFGFYNKQFTYNTDGTKKTYKNKNGVIFNYTYYGQGDTREGLLQNDGYVTYDYYTDNKQIRTLTRGTKVITYYYDPFMRVSKINYTDGLINYDVEYRYDANSNITQIIYPGNRTIYYTYDANNRLIRITDWQNRVLVSYAYHEDGRLLYAINNNNTTAVFLYDKVGRLDSLRNTKGSLLIDYVAMTLDTDGSILNRRDGKPSPDLVAGTKSYTYDVMNRPTSIDGVNLTHDSNGNPLSYGASNFTWDIQDRLLTAQLATQTLSFDYDPLHNRIKKNNTRYINDILNGNMLMETDINGVPFSMYIYGLGLVCRLDLSTNLYSFYHANEQGSITEITDGTGAITHRYAYDTDGNKHQNIEAFPQPFQYVGKYGVITDDENLYFMRARYYNPKIAGFYGEDPVWSTNLFLYANGDPINNIDASGETAYNIGGKIGIFNAGRVDVNKYFDRKVGSAYIEASFSVLNYNIHTSSIDFNADFTRGQVGLGIKNGTASAEILVSRVYTDLTVGTNISGYDVSGKIFACAGCIGVKVTGGLINLINRKLTINSARGVGYSKIPEIEVKNTKNYPATYQNINKIFQAIKKNIR